jgi:hypothetical protein
MTLNLTRNLNPDRNGPRHAKIKIRSKMKIKSTSSLPRTG